MNTDQIGNKIRQLRELRGQSQMDLELKIDASTGSMSRIESGKTNPTKETLFKIADALELSKDEGALLFDLSQEEDFSGLFQINRDFDISINQQTLNELLLIELLGFIDKNFDIIGTSYSAVDIANQTIQLKHISRNSITRYAGSKMFKELGFRKLQLKKGVTLTMDAAIENRIISDNNLHRFISPPLSPRLAKLIQRFYRIGSMTAIPILHDGVVTGVLNVTIKEPIESIATNREAQFKMIQKGVSSGIMGKAVS